MADLGAFLARSGQTPFSWRTHNCGFWLADWVALNLGFDPAAHLRDRFTTERGCERLLKFKGGLLKVVTDCATQAGLQRVQAPQAGDVGVVNVLTRDGLQAAGGLCTGRRWAFLPVGGGIMETKADPLAVWRVG